MVAVISKEKESIIGIGIDQGIANCGFSVIQLIGNELLVLKSGTIETDSKLSLPQRISLIYSLLTELANTYNPKIIGCEKLFFNPRQRVPSDGKKGRNKSASIVMTNMVTGVVHLIAGQKQIMLRDFVPGTVKKYVAGNGRATKENVIAAVKYLLQREDVKEHEADATAIGITAVKFYRDTNGKLPEKKMRNNNRKGA